MNALLYLQFLKYRKFFENISPKNKGIILYTSLTSFIIALFIKFMRRGKNKKKTFTKNQKKLLLKSKFFFKSNHTSKIRLEFTGNDGIKYTKTQIFLNRIYENSKNHNIKNKKNEDKKNEIKDKAFFNILNKYINSN